MIYMRPAHLSRQFPDDAKCPNPSLPAHTKFVGAVGGRGEASRRQCLSSVCRLVVCCVSVRKRRNGKWEMDVGSSRLVDRSVGRLVGVSFDVSSDSSMSGLAWVYGGTRVGLVWSVGLVSVSSCDSENLRLVCCWLLVVVDTNLCFVDFLSCSLAPDCGIRCPKKTTVCVHCKAFFNSSQDLLSFFGRWAAPRNSSEHRPAVPLSAPSQGARAFLSHKQGRASKDSFLFSMPETYNDTAVREVGDVDYVGN